MSLIILNSFFLIIMLLVRVMDGTFYTPAALLMLFYFILSSIVFVSPYTSLLGLLVLYSIILMFVLGSLIASKVAKTNSSDYIIRNIRFYKNRIKLIYYISIISSIIALLLLIKSLGVDLLDLFSLKGILEIAHYSAVARYTENFQTPFIVNILFSIGYYGSFIGGMFHKEIGNRKSWLIILIFLAYALIYTTKASLMWPIVFWFSGFLVRKLIDFQKIKINLKYLFLIILTFVALLVLIQFFRTGGELDIELVFKRILVYIIGNITPFTYWIENSYRLSDPLKLGEYSFSGLFTLLGLKHASAGLYKDFIPILGNELSNIHTMYRGFLEDYSLLLTYFLSFIMGFYSKIFYINVKKRQLKYVPFLVIIYAIILISPITFILTYNSLFFASILLIVSFPFLSKYQNQGIKYV